MIKINICITYDRLTVERFVSDETLFTQDEKFIKK